MWTLRGPFDGEVAGDINFTKNKLVKPGRDYTVGRKDCSLVINHKRISRKHLAFVVGQYTEEDVENPDVAPSLFLHILGPSNRNVQREGGTLTINAEGSLELQDGDIVDALHDIQISVHWEKVICYTPPSRKALPKASDCAAVGLSTTWKLHPSVTHHITPELELDPAIATSLLSLTKFVNPDWLDQVLSRGTSSDVSTSLEYEFSLPSVSQYRPVLSSFLPSSLKNHRSWEPNEDRVNMLRPYRVIFMGERGREASEEYKELVRRGGATYECCAVQGGRKTFHSVLAKGQGKGQELVIIAEEEAMIAAVGHDDWQELVQEAAEFGLKFIPAMRLAEAVTHIDLSHIDCKLARSDTGSTLPDVVLNTHPSEPTNPARVEVPEEPLPSAPRRKLVRRTGSRASSRAPSPAFQDEALQPEEAVVPALPSIAEAGPNNEDLFRPRKRLTRRAGIAKPSIVGPEDISVNDDPPIERPTKMQPPPPSVAMDPPPTPSSTRTSRLKRRFGVTQQPQESQLLAAIDASLVTEEPPHKKYKALFDESDPDKAAKSAGSDLIGYSGSITQPETPSVLTQGTVRQSAMSLAPVVEEEEESLALAGSGSQTAGTSGVSYDKQGKPTSSNADVGMSDTRDARSSERRAIGSLDRQSHPSPSQSTLNPSKRAFVGNMPTAAPSHKAGSAPGKPDKDEAFLKAVASTKRGKKHEDTFDREFNELRISKPNLDDRAADDWAVLANFGDDGDLRGNFMVVVEMDVYKKDVGSSSVLRTAGGRADWEGRPNFKKFKQKADSERRKPIALYAEDEDGVEIVLDSSAPSQHKSKPLVHRQTDLILESDDDSMPRRKRTLARTQSDSFTQAPKASSSKTSARRQEVQPLFLASDDEDEGTRGNSGRSQTRANDSESEPQARLVRPTVKKRTAELIMEDDSDDDTYRGFGSRKKTRR